MQLEESLGKMSSVGRGQFGETESGTVLRSLDLLEYLKDAVEFRG